MTDEHSHPDAIALALGSNLGERLDSLRASLKSIASYFTVHGKSAIYETPAAYVEDQPAFLNAVVIGTSWLEPLDLLHALKQSERQLGRKISYRFGPRLIDMDIVFYGNRRLSTPELTLPHPRLAEREFVLRPLADIADGWIHPETGKTVKEMLATLKSVTAQPIEDSL